MRLRLRIERNELPTASVLWTVDDTTDRKQTISQFLENVNERVPLEGDTWGLEDYIVTVGGYEAFHYNEIGATFQHEDEVVIKPLQYVEKRSRTLSGRDQITEDGRHLVDGVPFGRPLLKRPRRPDVHIPPRKKQRLEIEPGTDAPAGVENALMPLEDLADDDEDEEDDEDFEDELGTDSEEEDSDKGEVVSGNDDDSSEASDSSSDSSDSDSDNDGSSDDSSTESDSSSEADSWNGIESSDLSTASQNKPLVNGHVDPTKSAGSTSKEARKLRLPFEGASRTKYRNQRRREQRQLRVLKEAGILPATAGIQDMLTWQQDKGVTDGSAVRAIITQQRYMEGRRQSLLDQIESGGIYIEQTFQQVDAPHQTKEPESATSGAEKEQTLEQNDAPNGVVEEQTTEQDDAPDVEPSTAQQRKRLDLGSMNRLVFGSLGVRTPKTQADKDALQKRLADGKKRKAAAVEPEVQQEAAVEESDPNAWRDKIELFAVECCDEGVVLSTPPFPFQQRWDPQYQSKKRNKKRKTQVKNAAHAQFTETYDKYNQNGGSDALNYDDPAEIEEDDSYWEDGALIEDDSEYEDQVDQDAAEGFPPLPEDLSTLPAVSETHATKGDIVIFTELACSSATNWQPKTITGTARLESKDDEDGWLAKLAPRDRPPKAFDEEGKRVYSKFEMEGMSEDESEEDMKLFDAQAMAGLKLLRKAHSVVEVSSAAAA